MQKSIYFNEEHDMLRDLIRKYVESEVVPQGEAWEIEGMIPRSILKQMGELGLLGLRYPEKYGGSNLDMLASVVLAEEMGRSTFGGFTATVLVHTDMASPHLINAGNKYFSIAHLTGSCCIQHCLDGLFQVYITYHNLQIKPLDGACIVCNTPVDPAFPCHSDTTGFPEREEFDSIFMKSLFDLFKFCFANNCFNFFHGFYI